MLLQVQHGPRLLEQNKKTQAHYSVAIRQQVEREEHTEQLNTQEKQFSCVRGGSSEALATRTLTTGCPSPCPCRRPTTPTAASNKSEARGVADRQQLRKPNDHEENSRRKPNTCLQQYILRSTVSISLPLPLASGPAPELPLIWSTVFHARGRRRAVPTKNDKQPATTASRHATNAKRLLTGRSTPP